MAITGYLADFSLAELLRFLDQGHKTGLLTLKPLDTEIGIHNIYYIWSSQGRIVAAASELDKQGLLQLLNKRGWGVELKGETLNQPLGLLLKGRGLLDAEQLKILFAVQVMHRVCNLFTLSNGWFEFNPETTLPFEEMTGLSAPATEISLAGLRALKDWSALKEKLPEPTSCLVKLGEEPTSCVLKFGQGQPKLKLNQLESQVWELSNEYTSLGTIADQLGVSIDKIQQAAFRLIVIGVAEEVPMVTTIGAKDQGQNNQEDLSTNLSQSFLESLVHFLGNV